MNDIPKLIERAKARVTELDKCASYVSNMNRPRSDNVHGRDAAIIEELTESLSRLTVSPVPEEIAWHVKNLQDIAVCVPDKFYPHWGTEIRKAAAALEQMARQIDVKATLLNSHDILLRKQADRIRGLEAERDEWTKMCSGVMTDQARIAQLESERDALKKWALDSDATNDDLRVELLGIKAKTIEEAEQALRTCPCLDEDGQVLATANAIEAIRALNQPIHKSDCAMNNGPALPPGPCDCGAEERREGEA